MSRGCGHAILLGSFFRLKRDRARCTRLFASRVAIHYAMDGRNAHWEEKMSAKLPLGLMAAMALNVSCESKATWQPMEPEH